MAAQGLLGLPVELIHHVATYFSFRECAAARATCRHLDAALLEPFGKRYIGSLQFMRADFSLQGLVDLSRSRLSSYLKHVIISMEEFPPSKIWNVGPYEVLAQRQRDFIHEKRDLETLKEAFVELHFETVEVHSYYAYNPQAPWKTYGSRRVLAETTVDLSKARPPAHFDKALAQIIPDLLTVLGAVGARPKRFGVTLANGSLRDDAFILPNHVRQQVAPVLAGLEALSLPVELIDRAPGIRSLPAENPNDATYNLRRFLRLLEGPSLRSLKLVVPGTLRPEKEAFFSWLAASPSASLPDRPLSHLSVGASRPQTAPPPITFENLNELHLDKLCISRQHLVKLVEKFKSTLRTLRLRELHLSEERSEETDDLMTSTGFLSDRQKWFSLLGDLTALGCGDSMRMVAFRETVELARHAEQLDVLFYADSDSVRDWHTDPDVPCSTIVDWHTYSDTRLRELVGDCMDHVLWKGYE